ncbi:MAG: DNA cytosine methyltransferase [Propionibacteriaceae bacterium]|jgi:DNA (cytosine-5)-methyltransferase 1|nr:DNA cytosine methyltransferase [Propionibacteriaceae bacterium]
MRVLNLYAGIGGNRAGWPDDADVTAVELDPEIAAAYRELWPQDQVLIADAHQYLLEHFRDGWDFIWSSPPCQTHSKLNRFIDKRTPAKLAYPKLETLYGEILLLQAFAPRQTAWLVENVIPYYPPLVPPTTQIGRHYGWSNRPIPMIPASDGLKISRDRKGNYRRTKRLLSPMECSETGDFEQVYSITLPPSADGWGRQKRRQTMRNCVDPRLAQAVWDAVCDTRRSTQGTLWEVLA